MPTDLHCRACGNEYDAGPDEPWRCDCGHALDFATEPRPDGSPPPFAKLDTRRGLWTFFEFLPVSQRVTLGEGFTPLVDAPDWDAQFKLEYVFPTGSFKDRGATTTLSRAAELGVDTVIEDSSGNAGAAIATYAARAGLDAEIYVPDDIKQSKLVAIQRAGARPVRVEGGREAVTAACHEAVEAGEGWYASHAWNPAFYAGTMTFAFEVAAQRQWSVPDAVVLPLGHGTLFLGAYRGFKALREAGVTEEMPRLLGAQGTGYAPFAAALQENRPEEEAPGAHLTAALDREEEPAAANEIVDGIHIRDPARKDQVFDAIEATDGDVVALDGDAVEGTLDRLHRAGFYVEPTSAVAPAALQEYRREGVVTEDDDVVVPLTGSGMKTI
ncbi:pyridoxal-phosphate dependent enzyme [Halostella sp. JP-L12]|uniref:pyridoxal-phosphate dependent enzyme n=1 Tax=Halostella TaxID=1843185 RepID=UPI000EF7E7EA|nr:MULTISPECIES: pyridoxal-phosphate dependent enzyme [Halostella]NHN46753.1 pyridoxal-phosphate dependent enzyme [Halostella sp. JP-L12]